MWTGRYGEYVDKTYNDPDKANRMASTSYELLKLAAQIMKGSDNTPVHSLVPWSKISPFVDSFNRIKTKEGKESVLKILAAFVKAYQKLEEKEVTKEPTIHSGQMHAPSTNKTRVH